MSDHEKWMSQAFSEAEKAFEKGEVPVGAVIVYEEQVIARGHNLIETLQDPTAHAEMLTITSAANFLASWRLDHTTLYVTLEPCPMCAGAIILSRIPQIVYGTRDPRYGACGSAIDLFDKKTIESNVEMIGGVLKNKSELILKSFFTKIRKE